MLERSVTNVESRSGSGRINRGESAGALASICLITACLVIFNFFPEKVGYVRTIADPTSFVPLLAPGFAAFLPWLDLWWALALALEFRHLARGSWTAAMQWGRLGLDVMGAIILAALAAAAPFVGGPATMIIARFALPVASIVMLIGALAQLIRLLRAAAVAAP